MEKIYVLVKAIKDTVKRIDNHLEKRAGVKFNDRIREEYEASRKALMEAMLKDTISEITWDVFNEVARLERVKDEPNSGADVEQHDIIIWIGGLIDSIMGNFSYALNNL